MEVLIVVAIIGVLAGVLTPALQRASQAARSTQCLSQLRQIGAIFNMHLGEHNNFFPAANAQGDVATALGWTGLWYNPTSPVGGGLIPYVGSQAALERLAVCPLNSYATPERPPIKNSIGHPYSANYNVLVASGVLKPKSRLNLSQSSATTVLLVDSATGATPGFSWSLGFNSTTSAWTTAENRHQGKMNVLWADGHVSAVQRADITDTNIR